MTMPSPAYVYRAEVVKVFDGDTIGVIVDVGFTISHGNKREPMVFRFAGVDVYETTLRAGTTLEEKQKGLMAKAWLEQRLPSGTEVVIQSIKQDGESAKFGRYLAYVWHQGENLSEKMISLGFDKNQKAV